MPTVSRSSDREREELRRAAARPDQGPTDESQSGGGFPYGQMLQIAGETPDPTRVSFPFLRRMRHDHMLAMGLHLIEMGLLKSPWYYQSDNARVAAFADNLIRPIYGRLVRTILRMLWAGYSPGAKRFKFVQPSWVYYENGVAKKVWDEGGVDAAIFRPVLPLRPESCRPRWKNGNFDGIDYDTIYGEYGGTFIIDGFKSKQIDLTHSMWATHGMESADNSIFGRPRIANCAPIFHMYWWIWAMIGRAFENNADPGPIMRYPKDELATTDEAGNKRSPVQTALTIGKRRRSGSTVAMPSDPYTTYDDRPSNTYKWDIEYPSNETDFEHMMNWLGYLESAKLLALLIPDQGVTGEGVTGSSSNRNTFEGASDLRDESQFVLMAMIDEFIDNVFVRPALAMNMPWFEGTIQKRTLGISKDDEDTMRQVFQLVGQADWRNFGVDVQRLAESRGLPMLDPAERERQLEAAATQAEQGAAPVVTPTQGRRAMVTQTGFGETAYVQLESYDDALVLADDGDFVAGLPKTDHFSDSTVLGQARLMRKHANTFYKGMYEDFAIYVSRRRQIGLAEGDGWIDRLLKSWKPKTERTKLFNERVRQILGSIFDRTAALKLRELVSKERVSVSSDERAAKWLDKHGAELVKDITDTVRNELRTYLATEVRKGSTPKEVAAGIRDHFSDFAGWKSDRLARSELVSAYNFATLSAGEAAGIKKVQAVDGTDHDSDCEDRDGQMFSIKDAFKETEHPNGTLAWRLLPQSSLEVVRTPLDDGLLARYDEETNTVLLSPDLDAAGERKYMLALGERLTSVNGNAPASSNGKPAGELVMAD